MKEHLLKLFKTNTEIRDYSRHSPLAVMSARRAAVKIAAIDDRPFVPQTNLQSYGYHVTPIGDLKNLSELADYNIILCDLMGVGLHFDPRNQGASIISEVKKNYPSKVVIAYTGASMGSSIARSATEQADTILRKDIDTEEWIQNLDRYAAEAVDPYCIWQKTKARLVELGTDTKTILLLEDGYVRSVLAKDVTFDSLNKRALSGGLAGDVKAIVQGVISSVIFSAIFGPGTS